VLFYESQRNFGVSSTTTFNLNVFQLYFSISVSNLYFHQHVPNMSDSRAVKFDEQSEVLSDDIKSYDNEENGEIDDLDWLNMPLHTASQEQQQPPVLKDDSPPLTPLRQSFYPRQPRNEQEARKSFRQGAIDKAYEASAVSWPEHIRNIDVNRRRKSTPVKLLPRTETTSNTSPTKAVTTIIGKPRSSNSIIMSDDDNREDLIILRSNRSFHSVSARSTLRRRRANSYDDLTRATPDPSDRDSSTRSESKLIPQPGIILGDDSFVMQHESDPRSDDESHKDDIEMVVTPVSPIKINKDPKLTEATLAQSPLSENSPMKARKSSAGIDRGLATWEKYYNRHIQLLVSLALFSYLGQFARYFIDHIFGQACEDPSIAGWSEGWSTCVSSKGTTDSTGGAFFLDLPTNVIGCFFMGLLVSGDGESLAINVPMGALPRNHFFQNWVVTHVGLRTGFCGALTTFASWNTQMVIMLFGGRATKLGRSQWASALWGYIIGFYSALQSYEFGVAVAFAFSRWYNPQLAQEADKIVDKKAIGVLIHRDLPDFERRFLHSIILEDKQQQQEALHNSKSINQQHELNPSEKSQSANLQQYGEGCYEDYYQDYIGELQAWKETTGDHRMGLQGQSYVTKLHEIEKNLLVDCIEPRQELLEIARDAGWNVDALKNWTTALVREEHGAKLAENKSSALSSRGGNEEGSNQYGEIDINSLDETHVEDAYFTQTNSSVIEVVITLLLFLVCTGGLLTGFFYFSKVEKGYIDNDPEKVDNELAAHYRAQFLASLLSPFGTYTRWYLSRLNGSIRNEKWEWLPIGTLVANMFASSISALCAGILLDLNLGQDSLSIAFTKAIQVGFAGSCSTVSTFSTETAGLLRALPRAFWGYYYGFGTMVCGLLVASICYVGFLFE